MLTSPSPTYDELLTALTLCRSCADHSCYEIMRAAAMSCPSDSTVSILFNDEIVKRDLKMHSEVILIDDEKL